MNSSVQTFPLKNKTKKSLSLPILKGEKLSLPILKGEKLC
jgi:hypothetical protein